MSHEVRSHEEEESGYFSASILLSSVLKSTLRIRNQRKITNDVNSRGRGAIRIVFGYLKINLMIHELLNDATLRERTSTLADTHSFTVS